MNKLIALGLLVSLLLLSGCFDTGDLHYECRERHHTLYEKYEEVRSDKDILIEEVGRLERQLYDTRSTLENFIYLCEQYGIEWYDEIEYHADWP